MKTHITARSRLLTALKKRRNIPGPRRPIVVIRRLTESTVHFVAIKESATCPAAKNHTNRKNDILIYLLFILV